MKYTSYLRWALLGGLCLLPFVAFIVAAGSLFPNMFFPYITGKNFAFRILVEVLLFVYILLAVREPKYRPRSSYLLWAVGAFVLWMAVATVFSVDPIKSFWSNFERMDGYITVLHLFVLFVISGAVLTAEKWWEKFFQVSIAASMLQGFDAIFQIFRLFGFAPSSQSGVRADTTFGNATYLAVFMLFNFFITLFLMAETLKEKNAWRNSKVILIFYSVALVLQAAGVFFTETRGAILGLLGGLLVALLYVLWRARDSHWALLRRYAWGALAGVVILVGGFLLLRHTSFVQTAPALSRLASISLSDRTTLSRFIIWDIAFQGFKEKPITGWGQENFSYVFNQHYNPLMYNQEQWFDRAHNEFLDWLIAGGLPAFLLYVSFFVLAVMAIIRSSLSPPAQAALLGLLAAYAFNNLFVFDNLMSLVYFYLILAYAHSLSRKELPGWMFLSKPANDQVLAIVAPIAAVVIFGGMWMLNGAGLARAQTLIDALQTNNPTTGVAKDPKDILAAYQKALTQGEIGKQETLEQLYQFASNSIAPSTSVSPEIKQQVYSVTLNEGNLLLAQRKNDARLELFMSVFLSQFGQYDEAIKFLNRSVAHSPNKQQILFQLGTTYLQKGDVGSALPILKKAFDLVPEFKDARILYAAGLYYAGQGAQADALLTEGFGTVLVDDSRLLQVYSNLKQYNRVIGIWQARVAASPNDTNTHLGLAAAYFTAGNTAGAISELKLVEQLSPDMAAQVESIITQIKNGTLKLQ
jgi:O-antigen ligase/Flp pilus assembly protein TadD